MTELLRNMEQVRQAFVIQHTIMAGDFNFVLNVSDTTSHTWKPRAEATCTTIINTFDLYDAAALQSSISQHTYCRHRMERTSARYDRIYCSDGLLAGRTIKILPRLEDHAPVQLSTPHASQTHKKYGDYLTTSWEIQRSLRDFTIQSEMHSTNSLPPETPHYN